MSQNLKKKKVYFILLKFSYEIYLFFFEIVLWPGITRKFLKYRMMLYDSIWILTKELWRHKTEFSV